MLREGRSRVVLGIRSGATAMLAKPTFLSAIVAVACAASGIASAQTFPNRPIRIVVGFAPAGPADVRRVSAEGPTCADSIDLPEAQERGVKARGKTDRGGPIEPHGRPSPAAAAGLLRATETPRVRECPGATKTGGASRINFPSCKYRSIPSSAAI